MTLDELWLKAVQRAISQYSDSYARRLVQRLLDGAGGDVRKAVKLMASDSDGGASFLLGNFGAHTGEYRVECRGNAASNAIEAWVGPDYWDRPPDLVIRWREVFHFVQDGVRQPRLL